MQAFETLLIQPGDAIPLDRALLALAKEEYPDLRDGPYLRALDGFAQWVQAMGEPPALAMRRVVYEVAGFKGDDVCYYDPQNSLLNRVIDRRVGIPITLAIVYLEVARRIGEEVRGIGFPGHFLLKHDEVLLDPFDGARVVTQRDLENILRSVVARDADIEPWMLAPSAPRTILSRVLANLKNAYLMKKDLIMAARTIDRLLMVDGTRTDDLRDRGLIYAELGLATAALKDLELYLERSTAPDRVVIERLLPRIKREVTLMC